MLAKLEDKRMKVPARWAARTVPSARLADIEVWQVSLNKGTANMLDIAVSGSDTSVDRFVELTCQLNPGWHEATLKTPLPEQNTDIPIYFSV
jgi:hypothetical protein